MSDHVMPLFGYKPRPIRLMNTELKLDPMFMQGLPGWSLQTDLGQVVNLKLPDNWDDPLGRACGDFARAMRLNPSQPPANAARSSLLGLSQKDWDKLYGVARQLGPLAWPKLYGPGTNIANGQRETIGSIDNSGQPVLSGGTGVIAGFGINSRWLPHGAFSLGKRFGFASDPDISFVLFADKDAFLEGSQPVTGGGLSIEAKTSLGPIKFQVGAGRSQTGSAAWGFSLYLGPDFVQPAPQP